MNLRDRPGKCFIMAAYHGHAVGLKAALRGMGVGVYRASVPSVTVVRSMPYGGDALIV